jgi:hypothetical protein
MEQTPDPEHFSGEVVGMHSLGGRHHPDLFNDDPLAEEGSHVERVMVQLRKKRASLTSVLPAVAELEEWRKARIRRLHGPGFHVGASFEDSILRQVESLEWKMRTMRPQNQGWIPPNQVSGLKFLMLKCDRIILYVGR